MRIKNATIITWESENRVLDNQSIFIEGDCIREIGDSAELMAKFPRQEKLDARGQYTDIKRKLPGFCKK